MATQDLQIYYKRWQALDTLIAALTETYDRQDFPRKSTVLQLLKSLRAYAAGQFQFFYYGLDHDNLERLKHDPLLKLSPEFPAEDVLTGILDQIGHDLELIQRAADQRISGDANVRQTLANADKLAWSAVKPAINYAVIEESTTVLTYFQKSAQFYRIPYAQVALIAIPYTCTSTDNHRDYLAIPHEVGHYVYRHKTGAAQAQLKEIRDHFLPAERVAAFGDWIKGIFEETFADIYGCLAAGPVMALDMQDVALTEPREKLVHGDGRHPNPILRPYIYSLVLRNPAVKDLLIAGQDWQTVGKALSQRWDRQLEERDAGDEFFINTTQTEGSTTTTTHVSHPIASAISLTSTEDLPPSPSPSRGPLGGVVHGIVDTIIQLILDYANDYNRTRGGGNEQGWAGPITAETEVDHLYARYEENFMDLLAQVKLTPPESDPSAVLTGVGDPDAHTSQLWLEWIKTYKGESAWPPSGQIESGEVVNPDAMTEGTWGYILYADGWTTGGPSNEVGHPFE